MSSQIPTIFNSTFLTSGLSKRFFEFITKVGEARSKQVSEKILNLFEFDLFMIISLNIITKLQEEDRYVTEELEYLKNKLNQPDISTVF